MQLQPDEMVQATAEPRGAVRELVRERTLASLQTACRSLEGAVEAPSALGGAARRERGPTAGARTAQSSIPLVGDEGTAISRAGMRPAR